MIAYMFIFFILLFVPSYFIASKGSSKDRNFVIFSSITVLMVFEYYFYPKIVSVTSSQASTIFQEFLIISSFIVMLIVLAAPILNNEHEKIVPSFLIFIIVSLLLIYPSTIHYFAEPVSNYNMTIQYDHSKTVCVPDWCTATINGKTSKFSNTFASLYNYYDSNIVCFKGYCIIEKESISFVYDGTTFYERNKQ